MNTTRKSCEIWTLAVQSGGTLNEVSFEILSRAVPLRDGCGEHGTDARITAVLLAPATDPGEYEKLIRHGADEVLHIRDDRFRSFVVHEQADALTGPVRERKPDIFLAAADTYGRALMPYLAAKLRAGLTADCTSLEIDPDTGALFQTRPAVGGNILATIQTPEARPQMATVRPNSTPIREEEDGRTGTVTALVPDERCFTSRMTLVSTSRIGDGGIPVTGAKTVVSGGRGMKGEAGFSLLHELAVLLGGAVGGSREAVDRGWIAYPAQIGLSGKTVIPDLYVACGISGSIQHLAGMQTSGRIVSINRDPDAQIVKVSDLAIVGDAFEILPRLVSELKRRKAAAAVKGAQRCASD